MDLITEFLFDRDKRVFYQESLLKENKDKTLVTIRINYPGIEKSNYKPNIEMLKMMFKWSNEFEKNRDEFENKLNKYVDKLEVIGNEKTKYV